MTIHMAGPVYSHFSIDEHRAGPVSRLSKMTIHRAGPVYSLVLPKFPKSQDDTGIPTILGKFPSSYNLQHSIAKAAVGIPTSRHSERRPFFQRTFNYLHLVMSAVMLNSTNAITQCNAIFYTNGIVEF